MPASNLHAFWSYSRAVEFYGAEDLYNAMQAWMTEVMAPCTLSIFRDTSPSSGVGVGSDWPRKMVRAISQSALFFWIQSPRWLDRGFCRLEFAVFRDRVARAANRFAPDRKQAAFDELWSSLVIPVRWMEATDQAWATISGEELVLVRQAWNRLQVIQPLYLDRPGLTRPDAGNLYQLACKESAPAIQMMLFDTFKRWGITPADWAEMVEHDSQAFEKKWLHKFSELGPMGAGSTTNTLTALPPVSLIEEQFELARRATGGATKTERGSLGMSMVLVPRPNDEALGLWCSDGPVPNRLMPQWSSWLGDAFQASPGPNGALRWSIESVVAALPLLQAEGVVLPDTGEAAVLLRLAAENRSTLHRLGLQSVPRDFWYRSSEGTLALAGEAPAGTGSLILVCAL